MNGKLRDTIMLPRDCEAGDAEARALASPAIIRYLDGKVPQKRDCGEKQDDQCGYLAYLEL